MIDSGSVCSIIAKILAKNILRSTPSARWSASTCGKDLKSFSNEPIKGWICEGACLTVVEDDQTLIIGMDFLSSLGLAVVHQQARTVNVLIILIIQNAN